MRYLQILNFTLLLTLIACAVPENTRQLEPQVGKLKVGFDIDDTVLFSRDNFLLAPHMSDDPDHLDYGWVNLHDSLHSVIIEPVAELIGYLRAHGHTIYFITARPGINGEAVARHLSRELNFPVVVDENLFFSPKEREPETGHKFTTKHKRISSLGLHIFYGDSDTDIIAASIAGVRAVRVVRDPRSVEAYSRNYFGDTRGEPKSRAPFSEREYQKFISGGVGPFGETIYPIFSSGPDSTQVLKP